MQLGWHYYNFWRVNWAPFQIEPELPKGCKQYISLELGQLKNRFMQELFIQNTKELENSSQRKWPVEGQKQDWI